LSKGRDRVSSNALVEGSTQVLRGGYPRPRAKNKKVTERIYLFILIHYTPCSGRPPGLFQSYIGSFLAVPSECATRTLVLDAANAPRTIAPVTIQPWHGAGAKASCGLRDAQGRGAAVAVPPPCCLGLVALVGVSPRCAPPMHALRAYDGLRARRAAGSSSARSVPGLEGLCGPGLRGYVLNRGLNPGQVPGWGRG
jgi:hypothetical protein